MSQQKNNNISFMEGVSDTETSNVIKGCHSNHDTHQTILPSNSTCGKKKVELKMVELETDVSPGIDVANKSNNHKLPTNTNLIFHDEVSCQNSALDVTQMVYSNQYANDKDHFLDPNWVEWTENMTQLYGNIVVNDNGDYSDGENAVYGEEAENNEWEQSDEYIHGRNIDTLIERERQNERHYKKNINSYIFK